MTRGCRPRLTRYDFDKVTPAIAHKTRGYRPKGWAASELQHQNQIDGSVEASLSGR